MNKHIFLYTHPLHSECLIIVLQLGIYKNLDTTALRVYRFIRDLFIREIQKPLGEKLNSALTASDCWLETEWQILETWPGSLLKDSYREIFLQIAA